MTIRNYYGIVQPTVLLHMCDDTHFAPIRDADDSADAAAAAAAALTPHSRGTLRRTINTFLGHLRKRGNLLVRSQIVILTDAATRAACRAAALRRAAPRCAALHRRAASRRAAAAMG